MGVLKKNQNTPRPSEHPPERGFSGAIDVDVILDTCITIEITICYHK